MIFSNPLFDSMKFYILIMLIFIITKPEFMYSKKYKRYKKFGIKKNQTIFTLPLISILLATIIYIIILTLYKLNNSNNTNKENINYIPFIPQYIPQYIQQNVPY